MYKTVVFDDTEGSGWCVAHTEDDGLMADHTVYARHETCPRAMEEERIKGNAGVSEGERWSWFIDDIENDNAIHICFECGEPVPEHIQALVVLHTPIDETP